MGEWKLQVPVKLDSHIVDRLDKDVLRFSPFCEGRSAIVRVLIAVAYASIDAGKIPWTLEAIQQVLSVSNGHSVPSVPSGPVVPVPKKPGKR